MSDALKSLLFAVVLCLVCSLLLTAASSGLRQAQQRNVILDRQSNILKSVELIADDRKYTSEEIQSLYGDYIDPLWVDPLGRIQTEEERSESALPLYLHKKEESVAAYIIPINSTGLWGKIHGYLALSSDGATVTGFTVYQHSETPGLGGEIEKRWFQRNFAGKKIVNRQGRFVSIGIAKGRVADAIPDAEQANYVDGISGATLTGRYLSAGLKDILTSYEPVSLQFRHNRLKQTAPSVK